VRASVGVESVPNEPELVLARLEPRLELVDVQRGCGRVELRCSGRPAGRGARALEPHPDRGELLLDCPRGALALVEQLPLGCRELTLGGRLRGAGLRLGEPCSQLVLAFGDAGLLGREPRGLRGELALARFERLRALECSPLAGRDSLGAAARLLLLGGLRRPAAVEAALELCELALARGDRLGALAQRLLQLFELGARLRVAGAALLRQLAGQPEQLGSVEVDIDVGVVRSAAATPRRPGVEAFFPAVYAGSFRWACTRPCCTFSAFRETVAVTTTSSRRRSAGSCIGRISRKQATFGYASS